LAESHEFQNAIYIITITCKHSMNKTESMITALSKYHTQMIA